MIIILFFGGYGHLNFGIKKVDSNKRYNIILSIRALNLGGSEVQFIELLKGLNKKKFNVGVVLMYDGSIENRILKINGIKIFKINKKNRYDFGSYLRYISVINDFKTDLIYSFLTDLNIISLICRFFSKSKPKLIWGIRGGINNINKYSLFTRLSFKFQRYLSKFSDYAIFNSKKSKIDYLKYGYNFSHSFVIPNGFDPNRFKNSSNDRNFFRRKYKIFNNDLVIGINSRFEHIKGYDIIVDAISHILMKHKNIYFFSIGYGDEKIMKSCKEKLKKFKNSRVFWLGKQNKPEKIMSGWDIYCSPSRGEGFSNSIAEAMLCEVVPIVSNVGDSSSIVSDCGLVFESENIFDLINKIESIIKCKNIKRLKKKSRKKIKLNYSIENLVSLTEQKINSILKNQ